MLSRILDTIDEAAGGFIRLAYLAAGITAVALYFGAGHLPLALETGLNAALPWALAAAIETHTYITARRVRAAWQDHDAGALKVNLAILAGLLAFSSWNQLGYLVATWTPPQTAIALPPVAAYLVRALVVPAAFMAAAFLAPLAPPITAQLEAEARATLADVFRIARRQRRRMLRHAQRSGRDMTAALVELVPDPEARRVIAHAYAAIGAPVTGAIVQASPAAAPLALPAALQDGAQSPDSPPRPPTGPGSPSAASARTARQTGTAERPAILRLTPDRPARRTAAQGSNTRRVRTASVEASTRAAWRPGMSIGQLQRAAGVSRNSAAKWARVLEAEGRAQ
jgi:hypothetical protein